jgi:hypothetical protein
VDSASGPYDGRSVEGIEVELLDGSIRRYEEAYFLDQKYIPMVFDVTGWTLRHTSYEWRRLSGGEISIVQTIEYYDHPREETGDPADMWADLDEEPNKTSRTEIAIFKPSRIGRLEIYFCSDGPKSPRQYPGEVTADLS